MSRYISVFLWLMPKKNIPQYKKLIKKMAPIFIKLGATEFREYVGADLSKQHGMIPFPTKIKPKKGEIVFISIVGFKSKTHAQKVMKKFEKYPWPNMDKIMELVDHKRMVYGEFSIMVRS